jgi:hypothetical protein
MLGSLRVGRRVWRNRVDEFKNKYQKFQYSFFKSKFRIADICK